MCFCSYTSQVVQRIMTSLSHNFKIAKIVVLFIPIFVMDNFIRPWTQFSFQMLFHNTSMKHYRFLIYTNSYITCFCNTATTFISSFFDKRIPISSPFFIMTIAKSSSASLHITILHVTKFFESWFMKIKMTLSSFIFPIEVQLTSCITKVKFSFQRITSSLKRCITKVTFCSNNKCSITLMMV